MSTVVALFADGGCVGRNPSALGGTYHWLTLDAEDRIVREEGGLLTPEEAGLPAITNNVSEFLALVAGLEALPEGFAGDVFSDSQISLGRLFWGWKQIGIPPWLWQRGAAALQHLDLEKLRPHLLDGHPTAAQLASGIGKRGHGCSKWNARCDAECQETAREFLRQRARAELALGGR